jgi:hypothetical protein
MRGTIMGGRLSPDSLIRPEAIPRQLGNAVDA